MALKRGRSSADAYRGRAGPRFSIVLLVFFCVLASLAFFLGGGLRTYSSGGGSFRAGSHNQVLDSGLAQREFREVLSEEVIETIAAATKDLEPFSLDSFRKSDLSASWKVGATAAETNKSASQPKKTDEIAKQEALKNKVPESSDQLQFTEAPEKRNRRHLQERKRENRAAYLTKHLDDDDAVVKLENAAIERSKSVDSAILGKYSIWRKENENENSDSIVRHMRDQMIMAKVYDSIAKMKNKQELQSELQVRLKECQKVIGDAMVDSDLHGSVADEKIKAMGHVLSKAREQLYECNVVTTKLRAMLVTADEEVRSLKKHSTFLSQIAAKTIPNAIHCLAMRLTIEYNLLPLDQRKLPRSENLENPDLYHYALFSDNVLAASVVVNSAVVNAKVIYSRFLGSYRKLPK